MKFETHTPSEALKPFIKSYNFIESELGITNRILPTTSFALAFRLRGQISYINNNHATLLPTATFTGLKKSARLINYAPNSAAIIVLFKETGVAAFFQTPPQLLFDQSVALNNFFPITEISLLEHRLAEGKSTVEIIATIEQFLLSKISYSKTDQLINEAIAKIHAVNGNLKIKGLANNLYISLDAFEKRFRKSTGATPKQFSNIVKMNALIRQNTLDTSFMDLVYENGYYDQPHFNKDFKLFTGQNPKAFFKTAKFW